MGSKKNKHHPTPKSTTNALQRKADAWKGAQDFATSSFEDVIACAVNSIDTLLMQLSIFAPCLHALGFSNEHLAVSTHCFQRIKYCLGLQGPEAATAAEALNAFWKQDAFPDELTHMQYFIAAGLEDLCKDCLRTIQDAIAMSMILHPETFQHVMDDMGISIDCKSKLQHSYFIMKRYLRDVGQHLLSLGGARELCVEGEPAFSHPEQAGSSTDARPATSHAAWTAALAKLSGEQRTACGRPAQAGSSTDGLPPGLHLIEEDLVEYSPDGEVLIRGMAEPQQEEDGWSRNKKTWFTNDC
jgi:hypothetical protein